jgi:hypothetical protein
MTDVIVSARITAMPVNFTDPMPAVMVITAGSEEEQLLFFYYPDELSFSPSEFVGLSVDQGKALKFTKDVAFLKAP